MPNEDSGKVWILTYDLAEGADATGDELRKLLRDRDWIHLEESVWVLPLPAMVGATLVEIHKLPERDFRRLHYSKSEAPTDAMMVVWSKFSKKMD